MARRSLAWLTVAALATAACNPGTQGGRTDDGSASGPRVGGTSRSQRKAATAAAAAGLSELEKRVPHYFGPFPNWANSPFTLPDAQVVITGDGSGAAATAEVGANGAVRAITVTDPGNNYTFANVQITGAGAGAAARARINENGYVKSVAVNTAGRGYTAPTVTISGGRGSGAKGTAFGGVDAVALASGGAGYTFPTVDFDLPDGPDGVPAVAHAESDANGTITRIVVDSPGSGYSRAPNVVVRNGTVHDPAKPLGAILTPAVATATLSVDAVTLDAFGTNYQKAPLVTIADASGTGSGAKATATVQRGGIVSISVRAPGSGYVTPGGIRKFVDTLAGLGPTGANNLGQYLPVAVPDTTTFPGADYYEIAVVEYTAQMHSDLPPTKLRGYVQLETNTVTGAHAVLPATTARFGVDQPHYLGPTIVAQKDRPVRITFFNLLPTGAAGDLFLPVDGTMMGAGEGIMAPMAAMAGGTVYDEVRNPMCTGLAYVPATATAPDQWKVEAKMPEHCFRDNRATLHLHGGNTPWISDGTPHQWITPANETTPWPEGVSVRSVPDMVGAGRPENVPDCSLTHDGCMTFYYTNQQSARLMFYHDHAWGITRLNVYAGEAAGYLIQDATEQKLVNSGVVPAEQIPLVIQDRTFVPQTPQLLQQDPTWDEARWGRHGSLWYHHVYMPAQNPGDPSGMSAFGRWMYGAWFWPPADVKFPPIQNPYYDPKCSLDDPKTWQYQTDPFCEPKLVPGTPNISVGMEQFNDTPVVNGTAYPTVTLKPQPYRLRILNASNDRFWNLQWYVADATGTEVALNAAEVAAAQLDPNVFPTPDTALSPPGPSWIQIGTEGGFLPAPAVIPPQPITWITDPTRFDVGNVDQHSLLLAPAERADVVVDFSRFAGKTLILYNDAPAAFPARVASYDYYTGAPDLSPVGAPKILPGYGPNTRTVMQVKIGTGTPKAFNLAALQAAFRHHADASGVFESGQPPIVVGQAAYNSAYGTSFAASGWCDTASSKIKCDGYARISQQGGDAFTFDTLRGAVSGKFEKLSIPFQPKAIHDEMNSTNFDEFGRMQATLGVENVPATPALQQVNLFPYIMPPTEIIDTTNLPRASVGSNVEVTPIAVATDGTQIWKVTHNGVDTHPIHFHAFDVQVLNRVTWDNIVIPPDPNELGWKDTVRMSPLEDTIVAVRPILPTLPWELPNSVRLLDPSREDGVQIASQNQPGTGNPLWLPAIAGPTGQPMNIHNHYVNFGAEYVYHCHILSHEEMDMMRPVLLAYAPAAPLPTAAGNTIRWTDNSISETAYAVEKLEGGAWVEKWRTPVRALSPVNQAGLDSFTFSDPAAQPGDRYRVVAENTVGDTYPYLANAVDNFPTVTARSFAEVTIP